MDLNLAANDSVCAEDCPYALASTGAQKTCEAVDLTFFNKEVKGLDAGV